MVIEFDVTKMRKRGEKPPKTIVISLMTVATVIQTHTKIIKDLTEFEKKLHDMSSKVEKLHVCLNKFL